ncbi:TIGR04283 family arsenosugar biosynthesis glycosyltransferase [Miniphocaeibacter massiliensis]|uniref:TIGR04283 family arsenosugar biosynthesis glycosyltransferase n=1 Tax=Miniphocaeibacter massiliensis TaxID=2041841 RepID=UPI000C06A510|nr:TIGR04283 family arsenosugar biosynthesis glycosyltransferase [Miniphocaeibacter massiliensis]
MERAIIIFTRVPLAGKTKTRMMPALTPMECEQLHISFLKDIKQECEKVSTDIFVAFTPEDKEKKLVKILGDDKIYFSQKGNDFGEKMYNAIKFVLDKNYKSCVLIGTDIPEIKKEYLENAFKGLNNKDIVFGPTKDGGYYLVGMNKPIEEAFKNQIYGKGTVLENTVFRLKNKNFKIEYVKELSDIDTIDDLRKFRNRIRENRKEQKTESSKFVYSNNKVSIIIPIYNEESTIEYIQKQLYTFKDKCEIIFVDGGSSDNTLNLIDSNFTVINSEKGRANQMNLGAEKSTGDTLFFLHSDSKLPSDFLMQIKEVMKKYRVGCFGIIFDSKNFFMFACRIISNFRAKYRRIIFGDQGIFIDRDLFFELGMYPNLPIMEDYQFSLSLRDKGFKVGITKDRINTSDRRYPKKTIQKLKLMWKMYKLRKMYRNGVDINILSNNYKDIR